MPDSLLIDSLSRPDAYGHSVDTPIRLFETHISWVFLTGTYAYKVKKPVSLPFVDFSTLERRKYFCEEEVRLNRRTAPELYLAVVPVTGAPEEPSMDGDGEVIDYAVKMRQFDTDNRLDQLAAHGTLEAEELRRFAVRLASFHEAADRSASRSFGAPDAVSKRLSRNFAELNDALRIDDSFDIRTIGEWLTSQIDTHDEVIRRRAGNGSVRECHGDMHLRNLVRLDGDIIAFDCIEFDESMRWIDVIDDTAFPVMDLECDERAHLAIALLDAYLQASGDYEAVCLLNVYCVHRALVRAKVAALSSPEQEDREKQAGDIRRFLAYAEKLTRSRRPLLVLMHGLPASGKSSVAATLVAVLPALRVASDVERKRLAGLDRQARTASGISAGLYSAANSRATYSRLLDVAEWVLGAGRDLIVDATFSRQADRLAFRSLANRLDADICIVCCNAPVAELERRVVERARRSSDSEADLDVLRHALQTREVIDPSEGLAVVEIDTTARIPSNLGGLVRESAATASSR